MQCIAAVRLHFETSHTAQYNKCTGLLRVISSMITFCFPCAAVSNAALFTILAVRVCSLAPQVRSSALTDSVCVHLCAQVAVLALAHKLRCCAVINA
jgi:hypothetical protein